MSLKENNNMTALLVLLSNCPHVLNYKINIIFDDLGI